MSNGPEPGRVVDAATMEGKAGGLVGAEYGIKRDNSQAGVWMETGADRLNTGERQSVQAKE